jgi:cytochrome c oxidase cbb3-type subunit 4
MNMDIDTLRIISTVASFAVFIGILVWVWRHRKTGEFSEAAMLPFKDD